MNDSILWHIAKKRASFKKQLLSYILVNCMLWGVWFMSGRASHHYHSSNIFPWPCWVMFGWGIGLLFSFIGAYVVNNRQMLQREFEELKREEETKRF